MFNKEIISYNNKIYWIFRRVVIKHINEKHLDKLQELTEVWNCDEYVKNEVEVPEILFLREIPEAEIIE